MNTNTAKAWAALITAGAGVAALYGVKFTLPDETTLQGMVSVLIPVITAAITYLIPNKPKG